MAGPPQGDARQPTVLNRRAISAAHPRKPLQIVFEASVEARQPVLLFSLIIVVVFAPIFGLTGVEGRIFAPMGLAYVFSIIASSFIALTLTPVLCSILLANTRLPAKNTWITSTALTLLVLPALYARFGGWLLPGQKPAVGEA
jgi:Cu/Ag efflux pump CusA